MDCDDEYVDDPDATVTSESESGESETAGLGPSTSKRRRSLTPINKRKYRSELSKEEKKTLQARKTFQPKWMEETRFKGWLNPMQNDKLHAWCASCQTKLVAGKTEVDRHAKTYRHQKSVKTLQGQGSLDNFAAKESARLKHEVNVKKAEISLAAYFAEHNVAFYAADHLVELQNKAFPDSKIAEDISLGREKCNAIVRNVIAKVETEELVEDLKNCHFSIMVDESTDVGADKSMCVMVNYLCPKTIMPRITLLEMIRLNSRDCSAAALWDAFTKCLAKHKIPVTNIVGLACDSAPVMVGSNNSFWSRLKTARPWAIVLACICHSAAKVSSKACQMLPFYVEEHLRAVSNYLNGSPKRSAELRDFQEFYHEELKKIIKPSGTRWLVLHNCVEQYLKIQHSLIAFFELRVFEDKKDREAGRILHDLKNPYTRSYMEFLSFALDFTNEFNAMFQAKSVMIHRLVAESNKLFTNVCKNFMHADALKIATTIDVSQPRLLLPLPQMYLGPKCKASLDALPLDPYLNPAEVALQLENNKTAFLKKCQDFYVRAAEEMQARLPLNNDMLKEMAFLNPEILFSDETRSGPDGIPDLSQLYNNYGEKLGLDITALAREWRKIPTELPEARKEKLLKLSPEKAWAEIRTYKNFRGDFLFPQLSKLASCVMILPHSNADAEREFSIVTDVRTKKRNRMGAECLNAICVVRTSFISKKIDCSSFEVRLEHLRKHNKDMYARENEKE